jgi:hypothetical protein
MALPKFQQQYQYMLEHNKEAFDELKTASANTDSKEFREIQLKVLRIIGKNEDILCRKTESARYANFSTGLADKFWALIRTNHPEIDY